MNWWFADWNAFFAMGGYGVSVWLCVGLSLLVLLWMLLPPLLQLRAARKAQANRAAQPANRASQQAKAGKRP